MHAAIEKEDLMSQMHTLSIDTSYYYFWVID